MRWTRALQAAIGFSMLLWTGNAFANSAIVSAITSACAGQTMAVNVNDCALCHGSAFTTVNPSNMYWSDAQSGFYDTFCTASTTGSTGTGTTTDTGTGTTTAGNDTGGTAGSVFDNEDDIDRRFTRTSHRGSRGDDGMDDDGMDDMASAGDTGGTSASADTGGSRSDAQGDNGQGYERRKRSQHWAD